MKLVINIPCYNEAETLPQVLKELPKSLPGIDKIEIQVIDDGSSDKTAEIAERSGCRVIIHKKNLGLGIAFKHGMASALENGADIMVNTDADNQYPSKYIIDLIAPILENKADVVVGDRQTWKVTHFNPIKKVLQWLGSSFVRKATGSDVQDTVSGFRAYAKEALLKINIFTRFSYVLDTIMQCMQKDLKMVSIPITTNKPARKSRLFKNILQHIIISTSNLIRIYVIYKPFATFLKLSTIFFVIGLYPMVRFLYFFFFTVHGSGHIQSLIAGSMSMTIAVLMFVLGIVGDLLKTNRELIEQQLYLKKKDIYK